MKTYKIPFTSLSFQFGQNAPQEQAKRPLIVGQNIGVNPLRDLSAYKISYETLFHIYRNQSDVFGCVREWQENVGLSGYKFVDPSKKEEEANGQLVAQVDGIFNYSMPWRMLKSRTVRDLGIAGNAYWAIVKAVDGKTVLGFQPLDPRTMTLISTKNGDVVKYIQKVGGQVVEFLPEEIIHFRFGSDPNHELFGFSPMEPVVWEARTDLQAMLSNYFFLENDAQPTIQYILEDGLSEEEQRLAVKMIEDQFKGVKNRNRSGVLSGVKEVKTINISQKDMEYLQGRRFTTEKICASYGTPKFLLGYGEDANYSNGNSFMQKFYMGTIQPIEELLQDIINRDALAKIGVADRLKFEFKPQVFDEMVAVEERGLKLYQGGAMTLRQLKIMLNKEVTTEDEANPNFDKYILANGASAVLLEDVGVDPFIDQGNAAVAQNLLNELKRLNAKSNH